MNSSAAGAFGAVAADRVGRIELEAFGRDLLAAADAVALVALQ
jgi:hypothetical protein